MRTFIVNETTSLQALGKQLFTARASSAAATLERLKSMNPHVDFAKVEAGTVLLVPDVPGIKAEAGTPVAEGALDSLVAALEDGLESAIERVKSGYEQRTTDHKAAAVALRSTTMKALLDGDPVLRKQVSRAEGNFKSDEKAAATSQQQLEQLRQRALKDLASLRKALG